MNLADVNIVSSPLVRIDDAEIDAVEAELWISLPAGYREFMTTLGEGVLSNFIRVYSPRKIRSSVDEWRRRIARYWFWEVSEELLPKDRAVECFVVADTLNGDELVSHPRRPESLFVLPVGGPQAVVLGGDLLTAIDWMCTSGALAEPISEREFEPSDPAGKKKLPNSAAPADPPGESLDDLYALGKAWGKRRNVQKRAKQAIKKYVEPDQTTRVLFEGILWEGDGFHPEGYVIGYGINDQATGLQFATSIFGTNDDTHSGASYAPNKENKKKIADMKST